MGSYIPSQCGPIKRVRSRASLEQIFGSRIRVRLLKLFLGHPDQKFFVREITRLTRSHIHSVRRELANLSRVGLIHAHSDDDKNPKQKISRGLQRRFYSVNTACVIFDEIRSLLIKGQLLLQEELARQLEQTGAIKYLALTGFFVDLQGFPTDLLIVGRVNKKKCARLMVDFEGEFGRSINYTVLAMPEFIQRKEMTDRFLYQFFENKKVVLIDKLPLSQRMGL